MRLAFVETSPFGGLLHYGAQLADALAERGHDVDLITATGNELEGHNGSAEMRAILTPSVQSREPQPDGAFARFIRRAVVGVRLTRCWAEIVRTSRSDRYDLVVINSDIYYTIVALAMLLLTVLPGRPPIVFICHEALPLARDRSENLTGVSAVQGFLLARLFPRLELILLHGEKSRADFEAFWPPANLGTIPHGDESLFADEPPPPSEEERILFFGTWRRKKGISVLTEAFDLIASRRPQARLTLAGTPFPAELDLAALRAWAEARDDRVEVIDRYVPLEEVPAIFASARVVATPYLHALQSGVVHLAMTMARPVVATDVGDLGSIVADGETGVLIPPGDPAALAEALERLLADPALAHRMGAAGRERVLRASSWQAVAEQFDSEVAKSLESDR
jgi:glycosyltransferase involved in cell wall biosynthesis